MRTVLAFAIALLANSAIADSWQQRAAAFRANAEAERKKLGLDSTQARSSFPTPEVRFGVAGNSACPGETSTVFIEGKLAPGTLVGTSNANVTILKEEFGPKGWRGTVAVKPETALGTVGFDVIAPVSGITSHVDLRIGCAREWVFTLASGEQLVLKVVDGTRESPGEWRKAGKVLGARAFEVGIYGEHLSLAQRDTEEERAKQKEVSERSSGAEARASAERQGEIARNLQGCMALPPQQMAPCMQRYSQEMQTIAEKQNAVVQAATQAAMPTVGCRQLIGTIEGKKAKGNAQGCVGASSPYAQVAFTGTQR
jgi:hypothetical protein